MKDKPVINYGNIRLKEYYKEGKLHREGDKPSRIYYDNKGNIESKHYYKKGEIYKINEYKKGSINWKYIYNCEEYDIEFLAKYSNKMKQYMTREEKLKVFEYKMRKV